VVIRDPGSEDRAYGAIWFGARTDVDKLNRLVTLEDFRLTKYKFPALVKNGSQYLANLRSIPSVRRIPLDLLETALITIKAADEQKSYQLENEEPHIIFSAKPAMLVLIDGDPVFQPAGQKLQMVINTRALIAFDPDTQVYYLALMDGWLRASAQAGQWSLAEDTTAKSLDRLTGVAALTNRHKTLGNPKQSLKKAVEEGRLPAIFLSTVPTELLMTQGQPKFATIAGTNLRYVENSRNDIFVNNSRNMFYILVSGRWFRSDSLLNGPWSYVTAADLPRDFAEIPVDSPKASVLVSVPGTQQAEEALMANQIPQTAIISRKVAKFDVTYYGAPDFQLIEGTHLLYGVNTTTPVVYVPPSKLYYAVQNAVWFVSPSARGPWTVATSVPQAIYAIPPSCPIHHVTYVQIYSYTPTSVNVGYTPGYHGAVVSRDNIVVYGTGWNYLPYVDAAGWVPRPYTYGVGAAFSWSTAAGWRFAKPSWDWGGEPFAMNVYRRWEGPIYAGTKAARANGYGGDLRKTAHYVNDNLYADHDGNIYKASLNSEWQQHTSQGWTALVNDGMRSVLDRWQCSRRLGQQRWSNFISSFRP
jgi:hypothetical protein